MIFTIIGYLATYQRCRRQASFARLEENGQMTAQTIDKAPRPIATGAAAIGFALLSSLLYMLGYSLSKTLVGSYGLTAVQVTFLRCVLVLGGGCAAMAWPQRTGVTWQRLLLPQRAWQQRAAALALVASNILAILAFSMMPVTEASALGFTAPLLLTVFGSLLLKERVCVNRWLGAGIGFAGMLLIVKPEGNAASIGIAASVGAALAYAIYQILVRRLKDVATSLDTVLQVALVGAVLLAGTMVMFWREIGWTALGVVLVFTVVQTAALTSIAAALRRGEASQLAPWQFSGLLWAMLLDAIMFGGLPSIGSASGGVLIILGGLLAQRGLSARKNAGRVA
jgi:drug/metabolite transporter (DMT)-like permease